MPLYRAFGSAALKSTGTSGDAVPLLNAANTWTLAQTFSADNVVNGRASGTGGQTNSTVFGGTVTSTNATALGASSSVTGSAGTAIGQGATAAASSLASGSSSTAIASATAVGPSANASAVAIAIGRDAAASTTGAFVAGSNTCPITGVFFGRGITHATPTNTVINATGGSGTDIAGGNLTIAGGRGTGAGTPGTVAIQTSTVAGSSSTAQNLATRATFDTSGCAVTGASTATTYHKTGSVAVASLPSAATAGVGAIYHASDGRKSEEGAAAGTGVPVWSDGTNWKTFYDNSTVAA